MSSINNYSIGVVTYHARFDTYFKPLITKLAEIFPDKEIICIINGHPDRTLQITYLDKVTTFLAAFKNVRYLSYDENQSLSKCWNQLVILSHTEKILILNDDTQVSELFRSELESNIAKHDAATINKSWSHFIISKQTIKKFGWFDERFLGVGHEDGDYAFRMAMQQETMPDFDSHGLRNYVADQKNPGWSKISKPIQGLKYTGVNDELFYQKWLTPSNSSGNKLHYTCSFNGISLEFSPNIITDMPVFYDFSTLDNTAEMKFAANKKLSRTKILLQKLTYPTARKILRTLRNIKSKFWLLH